MDGQILSYDKLCKKLGYVVDLSSTAMRVFVSYSRKDQTKAEQIVRVLEARDIQVLWDREFYGGASFVPLTRELISRAHVHLAFITDRSLRSAWVNQEIGFAIALGVPQLPVVLGTELKPQGFQEQTNAICESSMDALLARLDSLSFEQVLMSESTEGTLATELGVEPSKRAELIASAARRVHRTDGPVWIRQRGAFSSFSIAAATQAEDKVWKLHDGYGEARSDEYHALLIAERESLEGHARDAGVSLILEPKLELQERGKAPTLLRLRVLLEFLESMPDEKCQIAIAQEKHELNQIILGDWVSATSHAPGPKGYRSTFFDWRGAVVRRAAMAFDQLFERLIAEQGVNVEDSRQFAIRAINKIIKARRSKLDKHERDRVNTEMRRYRARLLRSQRVPMQKDV